MHDLRMCRIPQVLRRVSDFSSRLSFIKLHLIMLLRLPIVEIVLATLVVPAIVVDVMSNAGLVWDCYVRSVDLSACVCHLRKLHHLRMFFVHNHYPMEHNASTCTYPINSPFHCPLGDPLPRRMTSSPTIAGFSALRYHPRPDRGASSKCTAKTAPTPRPYGLRCVSTGSMQPRLHSWE